MKAFDVIIQVKFLTTDEGGRETAIRSRNYGCPVIFDDQGFDCRFAMNKEEVYKLGCSYEIPIRFLNYNAVQPHLELGKKITLWEGKTIATGTITQIAKNISNEDCLPD